MKQILLLIVAMALAGCGKKPTVTDTKKIQTKSKTSVKKPTPAKPTPVEKAAAIKKAADEAQANAFVNTLGMKFVPVPGTEVQFCIWETRVKDYAAYAMANEGVNENWKTSAIRKADTHPVGGVSWEDSVAFCKWLTSKEVAEGKIKAGQKYRLPTDAEWSVAVGLGQEKGSTPAEKSKDILGGYPWGKKWPPFEGVGNYDRIMNMKLDKFDTSAPVGSFEANFFGIHDLGGNVWEWCEDKYFGSTGINRVLRGASWNSGSQYELFSSYRLDLCPDLHYGDRFGFRCVLANE